jgi:ATP-binding cassette subfamily B multidrug efflux pump
MPKLKENSSTLKKVLGRIARYRLNAVLSILLSAVYVGLSLYVPILAGRAIDNIIAPGSVDYAQIMLELTKIAVVAAIAALAQWLMNIINNSMTYNVVKDMRTEAFDRLMKLPLSYIDAHPYGETVSRIIADVDQFADGLLLGFSQLFTGILTIIGTLVFMLSVNAPITLAVVILTPLSLFVARFIARRTHSMFARQGEDRAEQTAFVEEMIGNQKVVQAFAHEQANEERFDEMNKRLSESSMQAIFYSSITNPATRFINSLVYAAVGLTGAFAAVAGSITVGGLSAFLSYANQYTKPFNEISSVITEFQNALVCAERIFALIEEPTEEPDAADARVLEHAEGIVQANAVAFSYVADRPLIKCLDLDVKSGERVAIVGPTGCGKTTLINLLMRFYDVNAGSISVDGTDIRNITRHSLRRNYGMVLQETWLKEGTIRDNIVMGKPDATEKEIIDAAKAAHSHGFITRLPNGYDTVIGEDGGSLSQGQKQLLCITRVMLCLPPMLILDEATSSIDTRTEQHIQHAFAQLMQGRTSFIVAHRLSTIKNADMILVMKDGDIIEKGKHDELVARGGFYAALYNSQFAR